MIISVVFAGCMSREFWQRSKRDSRLGDFGFVLRVLDPTSPPARYHLSPF